MALGAISCLAEQSARAFRLHELAQIQAFDELSGQTGAWLFAKPALAHRKRRPLCRPQSIAFGRNRFHPRPQAITLQIGRRNGQDRREGRECHEDRDNLFGLDEVPKLVDHRALPIRSRN